MNNYNKSSNSIVDKFFNFKQNDVWQNHFLPQENWYKQELSSSGIL